MSRFPFSGGKGRRRRAPRLVAAGIALAALSGAAHPAEIVLPTLPTTTLPRLTTSTLPSSTTTLTLPTLPTTSLPPPTLPSTSTTLTTLTVTTTHTIATSATTTTTSPAPGVCTALGCNDANPCTDDVCDVVAGCRHAALTGPACDDGDRCTENDRCTAGLCAGTHLGCTQAPRCPEPCADDGFSCTDDVCTAAGCLHVPVDSRCVPPGECTSAVCAPGTGAGPDGCVGGAPEPDGVRCAEDTDACTVDVCRGGVCAHERGPDPTVCAPLQAAFRETIALGALTRELLASVLAAVPAGAEELIARLTTIQASLAAAQHALAGEDPGPAPSVIRPAVASSIPANARAALAFTHVLRTPRDVSAFLEEVRRAQLRHVVMRTVGKFLRQGGRRLLNGTRALKAELRQLQRGATTARAGRPGRRAGRRGLLHGATLPLPDRLDREPR